jgi:hypothetical protein
MGDIKRCPCCLGRKKLVGFGFIEETCPECKGVGSIEDKEEKAEVKPVSFDIVESIVEQVITEPVVEVKLKRGRPPRKIG